MWQRTTVSSHFKVHAASITIDYTCGRPWMYPAGITICETHFSEWEWRVWFGRFSLEHFLVIFSTKQKKCEDWERNLQWWIDQMQRLHFRKHFSENAVAIPFSACSQIIIVIGSSAWVHSLCNGFASRRCNSIFNENRTMMKNEADRAEFSEDINTIYLFWMEKYRALNAEISFCWSQPRQRCLTLILGIFHFYQVQTRISLSHRPSVLIHSVIRWPANSDTHTHTRAPMRLCTVSICSSLCLFVGHFIRCPTTTTKKKNRRIELIFIAHYGRDLWLLSADESQ